MRKPVLNVEPFKSQYAYNPPEPKSAWHLVFSKPEGDNENDAHLYSDDDELFIDYATKEALSFGRLRNLSMTLAYGFLHRLQGMKTGDVVAIFASNCIWYPACVYAIQAAGLGASDSLSP
jgi:acyl-coenzyme A synthetase/AMP-(fatty) acid ligase